jgi:hypothetical protein
VDAAVIYRTDWLRSIIFDGHGKTSEGLGTLFFAHFCSADFLRDAPVAEYRYDKPLALARSIIGAR